VVLSSSASSRLVSSTPASARLPSMPRLWKKTSRRSPTPSSRRSRPARRATTSSALPFRRPWARASRSTRRPSPDKTRVRLRPDPTEFPALSGREFPGANPGTPVRDCRWLDLNHFACMRRGETWISSQRRMTPEFGSNLPYLVPRSDRAERGGTGSSSVARGPFQSGPLAAKVNPAGPVRTHGPVNWR